MTGEEEGVVETMHAGGGSLSTAEKVADDANLPGAGGLSAAEKGKQKADNADLPAPVASVLRRRVRRRPRRPTSPTPTSSVLRLASAVLCSRAPPRRSRRRLRRCLSRRPSPAP
jgi:hypothetical protein